MSRTKKLTKSILIQIKQTVIGGRLSRSSKEANFGKRILLTLRRTNTGRPGIYANFYNMLMLERAEL